MNIPCRNVLFLFASLMVASGQANALELDLGNKCSLKIYGVYYEFHVFLTDGREWLPVDQITMNIRIGNASRSFTATNTNIIQEQFKRWELGWKFPGIALLGWSCQESCISGTAIRGNIQYTNNGYCIN